MFGKIIVLFVMLVIFVVVPVGLAATVLSMLYNRRDRALRNEAEAHRKILEATYDRIWREVKRRCGLKEEDRRSFNKVYPNLIDSDMSDEMMLNWILDCNIDFDPTEYAVVKENIAADRRRFVDHQRRMVILMREHGDLLGRKLAHLLLKDKTPIRYVPVETNYDRWGVSI